MQRNSVLFGAVLILIAITLGAFGAHSLKEVLTPEQLSSFETGVRYQMYHGLALLIVGSVHERVDVTKWFYRFIYGGVLMFSGSIYLLSVQEQLGISLKFLGPVTPIGGSLLIIAWILFIVQWIKGHKK